MKLQIFALILLPSSFLRGKKNTKSDFFRHFCGFGVFFAFPLSWFSIKGYKIMITDMCTLHWYQWLAHFERSLWHLRHQRIFFFAFAKKWFKCIIHIYCIHTVCMNIYIYKYIKKFQTRGTVSAKCTFTSHFFFASSYQLRVIFKEPVSILNVPRLPFLCWTSVKFAEVYLGGGGGKKES